MRQICALEYRQGLLLAGIGRQWWILDTGSPFSFGRVGAVTVCDRTFPVAERFVTGATIDELASLLMAPLGLPLAGLLGTDVLNRFGVLFDQPAGTVAFDDATTTPQAERSSATCTWVCRS